MYGATGHCCQRPPVSKILNLVSVYLVELIGWGMASRKVSNYTEHNHRRNPKYKTHASRDVRAV